MGGGTDLERGRLVQQYFRAEASFWRDVYRQGTLNGAIYRARRTRVLNFVDRLALPPGARALEVGCGAGSTAIALAQRGLRVDAVDAVSDMVHLTREAAAASAVTDQVTVHTSDVHRLCFDNHSFHLAVAVGVMEWLPSFAAPLKELSRVLRPGGWLIANVDNSRALHCLLDPRMNPLLSPAKRYLRRLGERAGVLKTMARPSRSSRTQFDRALGNAGFIRASGCTSGFGPLTLAGIHLLPDKLGVALHHGLQGLADRGYPLVRNGGETYLVLAQKKAAHGVACTVGKD